MGVAKNKGTSAPWDELKNLRYAKLTIDMMTGYVRSCSSEGRLSSEDVNGFPSEASPGLDRLVAL